MLQRHTRRQMLGGLLAAGAVPTIAWANPSPSNQPHMTLGFGTYGTKSMTTEQAIAMLGAIGYDAVELTVWAGWDADSAKMTPKRLASIRRALGDAGIQLRALMDHLTPKGSDNAHRAITQHITATMDMARALRPDAPPLIQSTLGGGNWSKTKNMIVDRLGDWLELAKQRGIILAIKPHRGGVVDHPEQAIWLIKQLGDSPHLRMVFDYSHYAHRDLPVDRMIDLALPYTAHIAVKDAIKQGGRVVFKLPGETGTFDYAHLIRRFHEGGYRGDVCCEISGMVWGKKGYDPKAAAVACYEKMSKAFEQAGVARG